MQVLALAGLSQPQLEEKAKEIWQWLYRLESEKYDLEQRNKRQRDDLTELAERARQISKGGYSLLTSSLPPSEINVPQSFPHALTPSPSLRAEPRRPPPRARSRRRMRPRFYCTHIF